uniref:RWP-RK domain-containing protein n=2 Tax=Rhizophora mucronata TaxID=61149 RepID=A0A2P2IL53_RHIMU
MSSQQNVSSAAQSQTQSQSLSLTLDQISKHFSVPLSDAANNLGVCVSVLKRICRENGLDRWPYRKVLAGKSIEDIKRHAARERSKDLAKAVGLSGSQHQNNESPRIQGTVSPRKLQHQGGKDSQTARQPNVITPGLMKGMTTLDEFKHGFPSDGLSVATNKWWGSSSPDGYTATNVGGNETDEDTKHESETKLDGSANLVNMDEDKPENHPEQTSFGSQDVGLLVAARKRAVQEGKEALKHGVYRSFRVNRLSRKEKALLLRIFGSSFPVEGMYEST